MRKIKNAVYGGLFFSFMFIQYVVLRFGNQAGRGYLSDDVQRYVYLMIQLFVIAGFFVFALINRLIKNRTAEKAVTLGVLGVFLFCASLMFLFPPDSAFYIAVTFVSVTCLGFTGGAVYLRMSRSTLCGVKTGLCAGIGCSAALVMQYVLQLRWSLRVPLGVLSVLSFTVLAYYFLYERDAEAEPEEDEPAVKPKRKIIFAAVITFAMLLFSGYYNLYIHGLQIASGYTEYNVYTWPRLCMIPGFILFGAAGDFKKGRFLPILTVCTVVLSLLNSTLAGQGGAYNLNMCLFYISLSAAVSYYNITFFRLGAKTENPALWAPFGRILDSVSVLFLGFISFDSLPTVAVLALDIGALAVMLVLMAANGDLDLASPKAAQAVSDAEPAEPAEQSGDAFDTIQKSYGLTPAEMKVFRELVLTEDKQIAIGERLSIKIRTVQANVTSIYRKTGVSTRSGLVQLYNDAAKR